MIDRNLLGFAFMVAVVVRAQCCFDMGWLLAGLASSVLSWPPFVFGSELRCDRLAPFLCWIIVATSYLDAGVFAVLLVLRECEWMDGDTMNLWVEIARAAGQTFFLPIYFSMICPPAGGPRETDDGQPLVIELPGGLVVRASPGSWMDTVVRTSKLRMCMGAICLFYIAVGCTLVAAAAAAWMEVVAADTSLCFLSVTGAVSMTFCVPRFVFPGLNNYMSTIILKFLLPAALSATFQLLENDVVEKEWLTEMASRVRVIATLAVIWSLFIVSKRRLEATQRG